MAKAGNPSLVTPDLIGKLAGKAMGNSRAMTQMADQLLRAAMQRDRDQLDEKPCYRALQNQNEQAKTTEKVVLYRDGFTTLIVNDKKEKSISRVYRLISN